MSDAAARLQYAENMRAEWRAFDDKPGWYVVNFSGYPIRGPYLNEEQAKGVLEQRRAAALAEIEEEEIA